MKLSVFLYSNNKPDEEESYSSSFRKVEYLGIHLTKEVKDLHKENFKTVTTEVGEHIRICTDWWLTEEVSVWAPGGTALLSRSYPLEHPPHPSPTTIVTMTRQQHPPPPTVPLPCQQTPDPQAPPAPIGGRGTSWGTGFTSRDWRKRWVHSSVRIHSATKRAIWWARQW